MAQPNDSVETGKAKQTGVYFDTDYEQFKELKSKLAKHGITVKKFYNDMGKEFINQEMKVYTKLGKSDIPF